MPPLAGGPGECRPGGSSEHPSPQPPLPRAPFARSPTLCTATWTQPCGGVVGSSRAAPPLHAPQRPPVAAGWVSSLLARTPLFPLFLSLYLTLWLLASPWVLASAALPVLRLCRPLSLPCPLLLPCWRPLFPSLLLRLSQAHWHPSGRLHALPSTREQLRLRDNLTSAVWVGAAGVSAAKATTREVRSSMAPRSTFLAATLRLWSILPCLLVLRAEVGQPREESLYLWIDAHQARVLIGKAPAPGTSSWPS